MVQSQEKNIHKPRTRTSDNLAMSQTSSSNPYSLKWKLGPHGTELGSPGRASGVRKTYKKYCFGSEQACLLLAYNFCWLGLEYIEIFLESCFVWVTTETLRSTVLMSPFFAMNVVYFEIHNIWEIPAFLEIFLPTGYCQETWTYFRQIFYEKNSKL